MLDKIEGIRKAVARLRSASVPPTKVVPRTKGEKGDKGERGEKGTSFRWRGQVRKGMAFSPNDVVHYKGAAYLCLAVTTDPPPSDSWAVMCKAEDGRDGRDGAQGAVGPQGEQGVQGPQGEPGAVSLRWRGAFSQGQRYEVGDIVGYEGGAFVCVAATMQSPVTGSGWQVLAEAGKTGSRGPKGERGADGTSATIADGDYGDIIVSSSGTVWTLDTLQNVLTVSNTTESSSTSTGAIVCSGGIGATKAVRGGNDSFFNSVRIGRGSSNLSDNTAVGEAALSGSGNTGAQQTAIGKNAIFSASTGAFNTGIGYQALYSNGSGSSNTAIGANALFSNQGGELNLANGLNALFSNVSGNYNVGLGVNALQKSTGSDNIAIGVNALLSQESVNDNTAVGYEAGQYVTDSRNVFLGKGAGVNASGTASTRATTSQECVFVGAHAHPVGTGDDNSIVIGYNSTGDGSNTTVIGTTSTTQARVRGATLLSTGANGQSTIFGQSTTLLSGLSGESVTAANLIPANCVVIGISVRVTTAITGADSFNVREDFLGSVYLGAIATAVGTTAIGVGQNGYPIAVESATDIRLTANTSDFTGGAVRVTVHYISMEAATS